MQKLKNYYGRFFAEAIGGEKTPFITRLGEGWKEQFPEITGFSAFSLRLLKAVLLNQRVCIFSDYDTDAVCATSILYWGLIDMGIKKENLGYYAPDRFSESYGLNLDAIKKLQAEYDLIITVDCGINSLEEALYMQEVKKDLIITDHHQIKDGLPEAQVVLNPQVEQYLEKKPSKKWQKDQVKHQEELLLSLRNYIDPETYITHTPGIKSGNVWPTSLVGAGVIWLLLVGTAYQLQDWLTEGVLKGVDKELLKLLKKFTAKHLEKLLPFVAIATIADCQSIIAPLNRSLVKAGLAYMNAGGVQFPGLSQLLYKTGLTTKVEQGYSINSQDLGFTLSPILNASGRIAHASLALDAMTAWKKGEAERLVDEVVENNVKRKEMVAKAMQEVNAEVAAQVAQSQPFLFLAGKWSKGIVGLIASRVTAETGKPSFVMSTNDEEVAGSARATEGYDLVELLSQCDGVLAKFGGHAQAAGYTVKTGKITQFQNLLSEALAKFSPKVREVEQYLTTEELNELPKEIQVYGQVKNILYLSQSELDEKTLSAVWKMDPFGQDFPVPQFLVKVSDYSYKTMGKDQDHYKIEQGGVALTMFYVKPKFRKMITERKELWCLVKPSINFFRGVTKYEGIIDTIL